VSMTDKLRHSCESCSQAFAARQQHASKLAGALAVQRRKLQDVCCTLAFAVKRASGRRTFLCHGTKHARLPCPPAVPRPLVVSAPVLSVPGVAGSPRACASCTTQATDAGVGTAPSQSLGEAAALPQTNAQSRVGLKLV